MSLFGGFFGDMPDDPFFGGHLRQINRMIDPFEMMGGFGGFGMGGMMGLPGMGNMIARPSDSHALSPFGFPNFNSMVDNFNGMANGNCHSFSSSTMMTMSSGPDGRPEVYHESASTRTAPGGVKETKKSVCDSRSGTKRLAIGRHIGERAHVRERVQNIRSGQREETEDFINLEEDEADQFNREWSRKTRDAPRHSTALTYTRNHDDDDDNDNDGPLAIMPASSSSPVVDEGPIIEEVDDEEEIVVENSRKRQRERQVPEITEVVEATDDKLARKIKQRSRKYLHKPPQ